MASNSRICLVACGVMALAGVAVAGELSSLESLGKSMFFETALSNPPGQSCATCHDPRAGWTGPDSAVNASTVINEGAVHGRFGNRKPPTSA